MTNEELAELIRNGDDGYLPQLWDQVRRFVASQAKKYMAKYDLAQNARFELDDLIDAGYIAVVDACQRFDPQKGGFLTILGNYTLKTAFSEVAGTRHRHQKHDATNIATSLDAPIGSDEGEDSTLFDLIGTIDENLESLVESMYTAELHAALDEALSTIPKKEREILTLRYYFGIDYADQASSRHTSKQHISWLADDGLWRIRFNTKVMENLASFLNKSEFDVSKYASFANSNTGALTSEDLNEYLL